jgi:hypothetical protein
MPKIAAKIKVQVSKTQLYPTPPILKNLTPFEENYYSSLLQYEKIKSSVFNENPSVNRKKRIVNSSSIGTSEIDRFRQGVEITNQKHAVGIFKISAGTPGHIIKPQTFGVNNLDIISENSFVDLANFDPVTYLRVQDPGNNVEDVFTFPIITSDSNQAENRILNGIIEPLSIRPIASFFSIEFPFESHAVRGSFMGGNSDQRFFSSDQVLTVDYYSPNSINEGYYLDAFETVSISTGEGSASGSAPSHMFGYLNEKFNSIFSFDDTKVYLKSLGIISDVYGEDMIQAFSVMTGSTGNYVPPGKRSSTSGFVYDGAASGTDSIAFGGMTYR